MKRKTCVAIDFKQRGYTEAIIDDCNKIEKRMEYYKKFGDNNKDKSIFKLTRK